jgi:hypothetical protein
MVGGNRHVKQRIFSPPSVDRRTRKNKIYITEVGLRMLNDGTFKLMTGVFKWFQQQILHQKSLLIVGSA